MKLGTLLQAQEALRKLCQVELPGDRRLRLRRFMKQVEEELATFRETHDAYITQHGTDSRIDRAANPEGWQAYVAFMTELQESEASLSVEPLASVKDLAEARISAAEEQRLVDFGILSDDEG